MTTGKDASMTKKILWLPGDIMEVSGEEFGSPFTCFEQVVLASTLSDTVFQGKRLCTVMTHKHTYVIAGDKGYRHEEGEAWFNGTKVSVRRLSTLRRLWLTLFR